MERDTDRTAEAEWMRQQVEEAFADPRPDVRARDVFSRLRKHHTERVKAKGNEEV